MVKRCSLLATMAIAVVCWNPDAAAQGVPQGLFMASRPDTAAKTRLDFAATVLQGYDSDVPQSLLQTIDPTAIQSGGWSTMVNANAAYSKKVPNVDIGANVSSMLRYYAELNQARSAGHSGAIGALARLPGRTTWLVNQGVTYSPAYLYGLFPAGDAPDAPVEPGSGETSPDYSLSNFNSYVYTTSTSLTHSLSRRSAISGSAEFAYTDRQRETLEWRDISSYSLRAEYSRGVSRNTSIVASTGFRAGEFGYAGAGKSEELRLDVGFSYVRPLSATRRAAFSFNIGSSAADVPQVLLGLSTPLQRQYLAVAEGSADYQFSRGWQARGYYRRGLEYLVNLPEPVFADSVSASLDGLVSRRVDIKMSAGYSSGASLLNQNSLLFDTYTGDVRVRLGLNRTTAIYTEYLYYFYDFRDSVQLMPGIPLGLKRNGIRVGLTLWVPALRR